MSPAAISDFVPRRNVSLKRDGEDFIVVFEVEDIVAFRSKDANTLRKICRWLRYAITCDHALAGADEKALAA